VSERRRQRDLVPAGSRAAEPQRRAGPTTTVPSAFRRDAVTTVVKVAVAVSFIRISQFGIVKRRGRVLEEGDLRDRAALATQLGVGVDHLGDGVVEQLVERLHRAR
jgi:hypothetical protein